MSDTGSPAPSVWPSVGFVDVDRGVRVLLALGFEVTARYDDEGVTQHAEARRPSGGGVMFGTRGKPGEWGALGPAGVYVVAADEADVRETFARVAALDGVVVRREPHDQPHDPCTFDVADPDGNLWSVGTYRGG